jgi:WD40 repeat protein
MIENIISLVFLNYGHKTSALIKNKIFLKCALHSEHLPKEYAITSDVHGIVQFWDLSLRICLGKKRTNIGFISSLVKISDDKYATGGADKKIKIYYRHKCIKTLTHKSGIINMSMFNKTTLISSNDDMTVNIWDINNYTLLGNIEFDTFITSSINLCGKLVVTDDEGHIMYYDNLNIYKKIKGHTQAITSLIKISENRFATGSWDKSIKIWGLEGEPVVLRGHTDWILGLFLFDKYLVSTGYDNKIIVWDLDTNQPIKTINAFMVHSVIRCNEKEIAYISGKTIIKKSMICDTKIVIKNGTVFTNCVYL